MIGDIDTGVKATIEGSIKTINGESLEGTGNIITKSYHVFSNSWNTSSIKNLCESIIADSSVEAGMSYYGKFTGSGLPSPLGQAEMTIEVIADDISNGKSLVLTIFSADTAPYKWETQYVKINGNYPSTITWRAFQQQITNSNKLDYSLLQNTPTNISDFTNDAGYLTQHQDISGKANSADLATVATSGSYNDLTDKPNIPTVPTNVSDFTNDAGYLTTHQDISGKADASDVDAIEAKIPTQATAQNQLADKDFVNSSITTATATFKGTVNSINALDNLTADNNDYAFVVTTDSAGNTVYKRYKYNGTTWVFEYDLNNSSFTAAQWAAINSQATQELTAKLTALPTVSQLNADLGDKQDTINDLNDIRSGAALGATAVQTETDPTVPAWAKQQSKPSYNLDEVGDGATRKLSDKAPLASPALTGTPTAPTANVGTNTTQIATTGFVQNELSQYELEKDYSQEYLTFIAREQGTFTLTIGSGVSTSILTSISYSTDDGETWTTTNNQNDTTVTITTPTVNQGDKVMWKGSGTSMSIADNNTAAANRPASSSIFSSSGEFDVRGSIMSLLYGDDFMDNTSFAEGSASNFALLFYCYNMPQTAKVVSAKNLVLPAATVKNFSYLRMFQSCPNLTTAPSVLPVTTLAERCCMSMFFGCASLTTAPSSIGTSSTTLADYCCQAMFSSSPNLITAPELPARTLADSCYFQMFYGCKSLTTAPELPAKTLVNACYSGMFYNCENLTTAPELPTTTLAQECYYCMFYGCKSLTTAPELPATTLADRCYWSMFCNCTSLTTAPELPATTLTEKCYESMFQSCASLTTVPVLSATTLAKRCYQMMFASCPNIVTAPELPATTLAVECYQKMFQGCTNLSSIKCLATDISATNCTDRWVDGVAATGTFIKADSMNDWTSGVNGIPTGWTVYTDEEYEVVRHYELADVQQDISTKADKSEMSVTPGTGTDADKTTITLKTGTSATVLTAHQDISNLIASQSVRNVVVLTQAQYDALSTKDANTEYNIIEV